MNILMWVHIAGGTLALLSGALAVTARKGGALHARAGTWFFASMLVLGVTASILEPFRSPPGSPIGGIMVCYFVATSWVAARRRDGTTGTFEIIACATALAMAPLMTWGGFNGAATPAGTGPVFAPKSATLAPSWDGLGLSNRRVGRVSKSGGRSRPGREAGGLRPKPPRRRSTGRSEASNWSGSSPSFIVRM